MTVSYSAEVATANFGTFGRLLLRWKASVYKIVWREMLTFVALYVFITIIYRYALNCEYRTRFNIFAKYCKENVQGIPLTFVLGFYVGIVIERWWSVLMAIEWPDRACFYVSMCLPSQEPHVVQFRRAIVRYLNLAQLLVLRDCSTAVKTRYPTLDHVVADGYMTPEERRILDGVKSRDKQLDRHHKYWLPMQWASSVMCRAYDQRAIRDVVSFNRTFAEVVKFRDNLGMMLAYDWISIPLSYTQTVIMVVYVYFFASLIGMQTLGETEQRSEGGAEARNGTNGSSGGTTTCYDVETTSTLPVQLYLPIFPLLEFLFFMGWLKVTEAIMNPLGMDDDDIEINYIIDRNIGVSYGVVDSYKDSCPEVKADTGPTTPSVAGGVKAKSYRGSAAMFRPTENPDGTRRVRRRRKQRGGKGTPHEDGQQQPLPVQSPPAPTDQPKSSDGPSPSPKSMSQEKKSTPDGNQERKLFRPGSRFANNLKKNP